MKVTFWRTCHIFSSFLYPLLQFLKWAGHFAKSASAPAAKERRQSLLGMSDNGMVSFFCHKSIQVLPWLGYQHACPIINGPKLELLKGSICLCKSAHTLLNLGYSHRQNLGNVLCVLRMVSQSHRERLFWEAALTGPQGTLATVQAGWERAVVGREKDIQVWRPFISTEPAVLRAAETY